MLRSCLGILFCLWLPLAASIDQNFDAGYLNAKCLPLTLVPKESAKTLDEICATLAQSQNEIKQLLKKHGAILLRDCKASTPEDFKRIVVSALGQEPIDYIGGEGSRRKVCPGVYTSTEGPPQYAIPLHHELSCTSSPLAYISFYCDIAPAPGTGQTQLGSSPEITKAFQTDYTAVWDYFEGKGLKYTSRHPPDENFYTYVNSSHKTWKESFETDDPKKVDCICKQKGFECIWNGNWLEVIRHAPATKNFGDKTYWYNQAHLYHHNPYIRGGWLTYYLAEMLYIIKSTDQYDVTFDDGTLIAMEMIEPVYQLLDEHAAKFDWQKGDVLIIDNIEALHGRCPTSGPRHILTTMFR